ncbi:hypothetical protein MKW94_024851 [Papaver nudicaule]|uniref:Uncharacterized protein n=1 Tax=Papaver nudicaule TaxID=74823 RepID=A0AA41VEJ5_PAPNU|nr:hypothetical protein [Papaver nudicaule]
MDIAAEERLKGQAEIWEHMFAFVDSMALKCAVELGIPDIINSHGRPVTMSEIIDSLKTSTSSSPNGDYLTQNGTTPFERAHGCGIWDLALSDPKFNKYLNGAMQCMTVMIINEMLSHYTDGFNGVGSLVDVGGGTGTLLAEIVKAYPSIQGINFDLPHVVATCTDFPGVKHVGGDMFVDIPEADAVIMKVRQHSKLVSENISMTL